MMKFHFKCDDVGVLSEYIGCKIEPVLVQSVEDKFELQKSAPPQTPIKPGTTLTKYKDEDSKSKEMNPKYITRIRKLQQLVCNY